MQLLELTLEEPFANAVLQAAIVLMPRREEVFRRVDEFEAAAGANRVVNRRGTAEREAAERVVAAGLTYKGVGRSVPQPARALSGVA